MEALTMRVERAMGGQAAVEDALRRIVVPFQGRYLISRPDQTEVEKCFPSFEYLREELLPRYRIDFGASLLVLPEMSYECAPHEYEGLVEEFSRAASETGVGIVVGIDVAVPSPSGKGLAPAIRRMVYTSPQGEVRSVLSLMEAVQIVTDLPGFPDRAGWEMYRPITCGGVRFCLSICTDFRYIGPALAWKTFGPDLLINGAGWNFPHDKWSTILRGRAIDLGSYALTVVQDQGVPPKATELFYGPDGRERSFRVVWRPEVVSGPPERFPELYRALAREELEGWFAFEPYVCAAPGGERRRTTKFRCFYLLPGENAAQQPLFYPDEVLLASRVTAPVVSVLEPGVGEEPSTGFLGRRGERSKDSDFCFDLPKKALDGAPKKEVRVFWVAGEGIFALERIAELHLRWLEEGLVGEAPVLLVNVWHRPLAARELWRLYHISRLRSYEGCLGVVVLTPEACWGVQPTSGGAGPLQVLYPDEAGRLWFTSRRIVFRLGNREAFIYEEGQERRFRERYPQWIRLLLNREHGWRRQ